MRKGLSPLNVHMGFIASALTENGTSPQEAEALFSRMLTGVHKYHTYPHDTVREMVTSVWQYKSASLLRLSENCSNQGAPVLLVPSLVNKSYIFNLCKGRSMMRFFQDAGYNVYCLDWGDIAGEYTESSLDDLCLDWLPKACQHIAESEGQQPHIMGYCMGGTLVAGALSMSPDMAQSAVFLASPWDFAAGDQTLKERVAFWAKSADMPMASGRLDQNWLQTVFASLDPQATAQKFTKFADMNDQQQERLFVAIEDWLNDGQDLPNKIAKTCIYDWYQDNAVAKGHWKLSGKAVNAENIATRSCVVASAKDRLVDIKSSKSLYKALPNKTMIKPTTGHIGMIAGGSAIKNVWQPIAAFFAYCNS